MLGAFSAEAFTRRIVSKSVASWQAVYHQAHYSLSPLPIRFQAARAPFTTRTRHCLQLILRPLHHE